MTNRLYKAPAKPTFKPHVRKTKDGLVRPKTAYGAKPQEIDDLEAFDKEIKRKKKEDIKKKKMLRQEEKEIMAKNESKPKNNLCKISRWLQITIMLYLDERDVSIMSHFLYGPEFAKFSDKKHYITLFDLDHQTRLCLQNSERVIQR